MSADPKWTPDQPIVAIADVHKSFGKVEVLKGVSLNVRKGEVVCIIGPSGSGKSTLLRCINALVPIDNGSIKVAGREVHDTALDKLALRRNVGMVFQQYNLFPHKTALENVIVTSRDLAEEGMTCMLVTHEMGFAREIGDHIYFTDHGVIVEHGEPAAFFKDAQDPRTREFLSQIL